MTISITLIIIIITVIVTFVANGNPELYGKLLFNPYQVVHRKEWYRLLSHGFIHSRSNIFHLIFNMYVLYSFSFVETEYKSYWPKLGLVFYIVLYFGGMVFATLPALKKHKDNYLYNAVGASGAVSAVLFAFIALHPFEGGIGILFLPFSFPPLVFGAIYLAVEWWMDKRGGGNIAHDAHFYGSIFGFVFTFIAIPGSLSGFFEQILALLH